MKPNHKITKSLNQRKYRKIGNTCQERALKSQNFTTKVNTEERKVIKMKV